MLFLGWLGPIAILEPQKGDKGSKFQNPLLHLV